MSNDLKFDFQEKTYFIKPISAAVVTSAQKLYTKAFRKAIEEGSILKKSLDDHMRRQGLWNDEKEKEYKDIIKKSADIEYRIKTGVYKKASEVRDKAIELKKLRSELSSLLSVRNSMDSLTAEGQAENERFNYFVSACVYDYETQKPVFHSLDDYIERSSTELAITCATKFASYMYGLDENFEDAFVENRVLKKLNLIDASGNLINKEGKRVDFEGNLVDENGARVDVNGTRIDINNNPVIDDNVIDTLEFVDDLTVQPSTD